MNSILPYLVASLFYSALAIYHWQTRRTVRKLGARVSYVSWERYFLLLPLVLHALSLYSAIFNDEQLYLGVGNALSVIVFLAIAIYWVGNFFYKLEGLQILVIPAAALAALAPLIFPPGHPVPNTGFVAFKIHLLISMLAYGLFTVAAFHVSIMAMQEKGLHSGTSNQFLLSLPPLLAMEKLLFRVIALGFVLLTLTVVSGVFFSEVLFGKPFQLSHKVVFGMLSWGIFAALLSGRKIYGWRGKTATQWTLAGFFALFLAYIGSKFVIEIILHR